MELAAKPIIEAETVHTPAKWRGWQLHGLALLFFVLLTFWLTWPVLPNIGRSLEQWGDALLQTYTLDWDAHALATDPLHLFNANAFYPYQNSLAFSESLIGQAFLVTPLIWLTDNPVLGYNVLLLLSFVLSGWGTYLLVYELTGSRGAGLVSGVIFAFFPNRFTQFSHLHLLATQWMPFCLLFLRRFLKGWRWRDGIGFGLCFALELLSSTYLGLFLVVCVGLYLVFKGVIWSLKREFVKSGSIQRSGRLLLILVGTGLLVLPFLKPYFDVKNDLGFERSQAEVENWSAAPNYYLDLFKFNRLNEQFLNPTLQSLKWWEVGGGERQLYLGLTAMALGALGLIVVWRRRKTHSDGLFYALLGLVACLFTFGPVWHSGRFGDVPLPYALLYNFLPGFQALRVPVRFIYVVALALAILAGFGVSALLPRVRLRPFWSSLALGTVTGGLAFVYSWGIWAIVPVIIVGGASFWWQRGSLFRPPVTHIFVTLVIGLLCFEYASDVSIKDSDLLQKPPPAAQWLAQHPGPVLNVPLSGTNYSDMFYTYWSRLGWQPLMNGSSGFMPPAYDALRSAWGTEFPSARILTLLQGLEIRYLVVDSDSPEVQPTWANVQKALANFPQLKLSIHFGGVYIYELQADHWLRNLGQTIKPTDPLYFVEYRRSQPQLLELAAYFMESTGVSQSSSLYGNISIANRALPALPTGTPARYALVQAGEDPTLYGFGPSDKKWSNALVDFYQQNINLVARYDFSRADGAKIRTQPFTFEARPDKLVFDTQPNVVPGKGGEPFYVKLEVASLVSQTLTINVNGKEDTLNVAPGLSSYRTAGFRLAGDEPLPFAIKNSNGQPYLVTTAELWHGEATPLLTLQPNVVLVSATSRRDNNNGIAALTIVTPGGNDKYTATLDVYTRPYGAHPQGHYGYWSVALDGGHDTNLQFRLDLAQKTMQTQLNGGSIPNYPPNPKDLDISRYAKLGDFRANLNLYRGDVFIGSVRLFDFTVNGDKNDAASRHVSDFSAYTLAITYLVLKQ